MYKKYFIVGIFCFAPFLAQAGSNEYSPPPFEPVPMDRALSSNNAGDGYQGYDPDTDILSLTNSQRVDLGSDGYAKGLASWTGGAATNTWSLLTTKNCQNVKLGCSSESSCQYASVQPCEYQTDLILTDVEGTLLETKQVAATLHFFSNVFVSGPNTSDLSNCKVCPTNPEDNTQLNKLKRLAGVN